ncbi:uncharacterized protein LOC141600930 [Silene latifolia]|uniref:uncharacterized protein LOC141600930 n=1 Tax=Silene latifolia TaxID=37657 RepID=UPI003D77E535
MLAASIPSEFRQVCMCKGFGTTLTDPTLQWYINLPTGSIQSFSNLIKNFNQQFASSRELEKRSSDLYRISQKSNKTLRVFFARFNEEKVSIPRCDVGTVVEAFRLKEDKSYKVGASCDSKEYEKPNRKSGLIQRLENMGSTVRWPRKVKNPNPRRDHSKWFEFHMDVGHTMEDCFTLRKEVAYLLKAGYLKDLIKSKGIKEDQSKEIQEQRQERNLPLPPSLYEVKFINGGSEIYGLTSSAAKKIAMTPQIKSPCKPGHIPSITFADCDMVGIPDLHHDGLVISMQIGIATVRRIIVDSGSSVNMIILDVLKAMKISEDEITKKSSVLVGAH